MLCFLHSKKRSKRGLPKKWRGLPRVCPGFAQGFAQGFAHTWEGFAEGLPRRLPKGLLVVRGRISVAFGKETKDSYRHFSGAEHHPAHQEGGEGGWDGGEKRGAQHLASFNKREEEFPPL